MANPTADKPIIAKFTFKAPTEFLVQGHRVILLALSVRFEPRVKWLSQTVEIDAKTGVYDYIRGRVLLAGGPNNYVIKGINFDTAVPLASPPPVADLGIGLRPGEVDVKLLLVEGLDFPKGRESEMPKLDALVLPEDLSLRITDSPPQQNTH